MTTPGPGHLYDDAVRLPHGPRLALRRADGGGRPFLLVHGLASNARLWDGVARRLAAAGHEVVAVDLRGHGLSEQVPDGHSTQQAAADLAALVDLLGLVGDRTPIAVGQSWGGNVVLTLAAEHGRVAGLGLVDGGWIALGERFATFDDCWAVLAPPVFGSVPLERMTERLRSWHPDWPEESIQGALANFAVNPDRTVAPRLAREHHRQILRSLWEADVTSLYPRVTVPVLLTPVRSDDHDPMHRDAPRRAVELLPDAVVVWYEDADHDLHAQQPDRLVADLADLAARVEAGR